MIQFKGDKIGVFVETISGGISASFTPIFTVTVSEDKINLDLSSAAKSYYEFPKDLSVKEQVSYLLSCLTRAEMNEQTDMHKVINAFIDHTLEESTGLIIFTRTGYCVQEVPTEQCQPIPNSC